MVAQSFGVVLFDLQIGRRANIPFLLCDSLSETVFERDLERLAFDGFGVYCLIHQMLRRFAFPESFDGHFVGDLFFRFVDVVGQFRAIQFDMSRQR